MKYVKKYIYLFVVGISVQLVKQSINLVGRVMLLRDSDGVYRLGLNFEVTKLAKKPKTDKL